MIWLSTRRRIRRRLVEARKRREEAELKARLWESRYKNLEIRHEILLGRRVSLEDLANLGFEVVEEGSKTTVYKLRPQRAA